MNPDDCNTRVSTLPIDLRGSPDWMPCPECGKSAPMNTHCSSEDALGNACGKWVAAPSLPAPLPVDCCPNCARKLTLCQCAVLEALGNDPEVAHRDEWHKPRWERKR